MNKRERVKILSIILAVFSGIIIRVAETTVEYLVVLISALVAIYGLYYSTRKEA